MRNLNKINKTKKQILWLQSDTNLTWTETIINLFY